MRSDLYINGIGCAEYGAVLLEDHYVGATPVTHSRLKTTGQVQGWTHLATEYALRTIYLPFCVIGPTPRDAAVRKSHLDAVLARDPVELLCPNGLLCTASLDSSGDVEYFRKDGTAILCSYEMVGYAHDPLVIQRVSDGIMFADGTAPEMACRITCAVGAAAAYYAMAGIVWTNVSAGDVLTVDGLEKRVLRNGAPAITKTNLISWPTLKPGLNRLTAPDDLTVAYYPIWQ